MSDVEGGVDNVLPGVRACLVFAEDGVIGGPALAPVLLNLPDTNMHTYL